jgi:hypothetical protein
MTKNLARVFTSEIDPLIEAAKEAQRVLRAQTRSLTRHLGLADTQQLRAIQDEEIPNAR